MAPPSRVLDVLSLDIILGSSYGFVAIAREDIKLSFGDFLC
jgi:hypothetical protein